MWNEEARYTGVIIFEMLILLQQQSEITNFETSNHRLIGIAIQCDNSVCCRWVNIISRLVYKIGDISNNDNDNNNDNIILLKLFWDY